MSIAHAARSRIKRKLEHLKNELTSAHSGLKNTAESMTELNTLSAAPEQLDELMIEIIGLRDLVETSIQNIDKKIAEAGPLPYTD